MSKPRGDAKWKQEEDKRKVRDATILCRHLEKTKLSPKQEKLFDEVLEILILNPFITMFVEGRKKKLTKKEEEIFQDIIQRMQNNPFIGEHFYEIFHPWEE